MPPQGDLFSATQRPWWDHLSVSAAQKMRARHDFSIIDFLSILIEEVEQDLARLSVSEPWAEMVPFLIQLPGFGLLVTMTVLGAIGIISRFPSDKKLVGTCPVRQVQGYAGLGSRIHDSGKTKCGGGITKQGRRDLRRVMVEAAWAAVRSSKHWQAQFDKLSPRIGKEKAIPSTGSGQASPLLVNSWSPSGMSSPNGKLTLYLARPTSLWSLGPKTRGLGHRTKGTGQVPPRLS